MNRREAHRREEGHFLAKKKKKAHAKAWEPKGSQNAGRIWRALRMDCVSRARVRQAETGRGLGSLTVYLQSFLKSCGTSLKSVTQRNDIIRFLFSRGILLAGWLANVLGTGQPGFGEECEETTKQAGGGGWSPG